MKNVFEKLNAFKAQGLIKTADSIVKHKGIDGKEITNNYGTAFYREREYPLDYCHGGYTISPTILPKEETLFGIFREEIPKGNRVVFLDTETTGLAGGTGTYPFMIGLGWYEYNVFKIRQYFLRHPSEETPLIYELNQFLKEFEILATFNGKSFDMPLIATRFILSGISDEPFQGIHIDLLHSARRIWKESLPSCSLTSLEKHLMNMERIDDIPGELIPAVYFNFLRSGKTREIEKVFEHNLLDILSMVSLIKAMGERLKSPDLCSFEERYAIGKALEKSGDLDGASVFYCNSQLDQDNPICRRTLRNLSLIYKKKGEWEKAVEIWESLINSGGSFSLFPYIELAKYYEHKAKDYDKAIDYVDMSMESPGFSLLDSIEEQELINRLNRLVHKTTKVQNTKRLLILCFFLDSK